MAAHKHTDETKPVHETPKVLTGPAPDDATMPTVNKSIGPGLPPYTPLPITEEGVAWALAGDVIRRMDGQQFSKESGKDAGKWCAEFVKGFVKAMNEKPDPAKHTA